MIVHFVCSGNTFRSRLAESYLNSISKNGVKAISSGIIASKNENGAITWYAQRIVQREGLVEYSKAGWQETTKQLLDKSDLIIFMEPKHLEFCRKKFNFSKNHEIWFINDLEDYEISANPLDFNEDLRAIKITEMTFEAIKDKVQNLLRKI